MYSIETSAIMKINLIHMSHTDKKQFQYKKENYK